MVEERDGRIGDGVCFRGEEAGGGVVGLELFEGWGGFG